MFELLSGFRYGEQICTCDFLIPSLFSQFVFHLYDMGRM